MLVKIDLKSVQGAIKKLSKVKADKKVYYTSLYKLEAKDNSLYITRNSNGVVQIKLTAEVIQPGDVYIEDADIKILQKLTNNCELVITGGKIEVGNNRTIEFLPVDWNMKEIFSIDRDVIMATELVANTTGKELMRLLEVKYATCKDESRPILKGINFKENIVCALDGYRMSLRETNDFNLKYEFTIDEFAVKFLSDFTKADSKVEIYYCSTSSSISFIKFRIDNITMLLNTLDGNFINYNHIIPDYENFNNIINVSTDTVNDSLKLITTLGDTVILRECSKHDELKFTLENQVKEGGRCKVKDIIDNSRFIKHTNELLIALNPEYMFDCIKVISKYDNDKFVLYSDNKITPIIIKTNQDRYNLDMILPVRLIGNESWNNAI